MPTILLNRFPVPHPAPSVRFITEALWTCHSSSRHTWRQRSDVFLATGQPLSVMPRATRNGLDPVITPVPGWKGTAPTWFGIPCHVGRVTMWLPTQETPGLFQPFPLLILFPQQDVPDASPFVQIGVQFLLEYQAQVILNEAGTGGNRLVIP